MAIDQILSAFAGLGAQVPQLDFVPHDISKVQVMYGVPSIPVIGLDYVFARHNRSHKRLFMSLTGSGVFVTNQNRSGIIEIGIMEGSPTQAGLEVAQLTGIPYPVAITDRTGVLIFVTAASCQLVETPEWRRELIPGVVPYTFEVVDLIISHGFRELA